MFLSPRRIKWYTTWPTWVTRDLDLRSNFEVDLSRSKYAWFDSSRWDKYDVASCHCYCCNFPNEKVIRKKLFHSKQLFWLRWPVEAKRLTLGQIWHRYCNGEFNYVSNAIFGIFLSIIVPEIMEVFPKWCSPFVKNSKILHFFAPGGHNFDPNKKKIRNSFDWVFDDISNAACRMSLRRSGTELDGGADKPPPPWPAVDGAPARRGLTLGLNGGLRSPSNKDEAKKIGIKSFSVVFRSDFRIQRKKIP